MSDRYVFETSSSEPCDICDTMEGEYDYPPTVPVHPRCQCSVGEAPPDPATPADADDCELEVRNLEIWEETYVETENHTYENRGDADAEVEAQIELRVEQSSFDDGVEEALEWEPTYGNDSLPAELPASSSGDIVLQVEYTQMVCVGELWQICGKEDDIEGVTNITERYVGPAGGMMIARTALLEAEVEEGGNEERGEDGDSTPYFDDDDEVPT